MRRQGPQGQSPLWMVVAIGLVFVVGLGVGYLTWGRRVSRLEQAVRSLEQDMDKVKVDTFQLRQDLVARRLFPTEGAAAPAAKASTAPTPSPPPPISANETSPTFPGVQIITFYLNGKPAGAPIAEFPPGNPLEPAGLKQGDTIKKINGEPIDTGEKALKILSEHVTAKKPMTIEVERGRDVLTLTYRPR